MSLTAGRETYRAEKNERCFNFAILKLYTYFTDPLYFHSTDVL
jgi:hypothetical protein